MEAPNFEAGEIFVEVSAGADHTCALTDWSGGNAVYCWGYAPYASMGGYGVDLGDGLYWQGYYDLVQVDAGTYGVGVIREPDDAFGYGYPFGSYPVPAGTSAEDFAVGSNHWCRVDGLGDLHCVGNDAYGKSTPPAMTSSCPSAWPYG